MTIEKYKYCKDCRLQGAIHCCDVWYGCNGMQELTEQEISDHQKIVNLKKSTEGTILHSLK